jgi:hypothetical protein
VAEATAAAIKINNLEDIHCVRDAGTVGFRRPPSASVGIGGCGAPQPAEALENMMFSRIFCFGQFGQQIQLVEAAGGKPQRKFGGVARDVVIKLGRSAASGRNDGSEQSLAFSPCARCAQHREIQENLRTAQPERPG